MGLFSKFSEMFRRQPSVAPVMERQGRTRVEVVEVQRFGAAETNRLNRAHWSKAHGQSINNDLAAQLSILQARCSYEYGSNPLFEGVCNTFRDDVIGRDGPLLQIVSDNEKFNAKVEAAVKTVFADPDPSHRYGGVEIMKTWVLSLLLAGSYVNITTNVKRAFSKLTFGWRTIHARRLVTPPEYVSDRNTAFGCKSDDNGAPIEYYVDDTPRQGAYQHKGMKFKAFPAEMVQHVYSPVEAEQLTGYPWMTSTLDTAADIRDYDSHVMDAAKNHAAHALTMFAADPRLTMQVKPISKATLPVSRSEINVAPPGYQFGTTDATQPAAQYVDFRRERAGELGRPIHMPLLVVLLTAADANFATAQYEGTVYCDGVKNCQGLIERRSLIPFVLSIITELVLRGEVEVPESFEMVFTWNVPAHANIEKFVKALETMVEMGFIAPSQASSMLGYDWDKVVAARKKCKKDLIDNDLPPTPTKPTGTPSKEVTDDGDGEGNGSKPKKGRESRARFNFAA